MVTCSPLRIGFLGPLPNGQFMVLTFHPGLPRRMACSMSPSFKTFTSSSVNSTSARPSTLGRSGMIPGFVSGWGVTLIDKPTNRPRGRGENNPRSDLLTMAITVTTYSILGWSSKYPNWKASRVVDNFSRKGCFTTFKWEKRTLMQQMADVIFD